MFTQSLKVLIFIKIIFCVSTQIVFAQRNARWIIKNDPVLNFNGRWNVGVEKWINSQYSLQTNISIVKSYGSSKSSFGNPGAFKMLDSDHTFKSLRGNQAQIYLRNYVNSRNWLNGTFWGIGLGHRHEILSYSVRSNINKIQTAKTFRFNSSQISYIMGCQKKLTHGLYYSIVGGVELRTLPPNIPYSYQNNQRNIRNTNGIIQISFVYPFFHNYSEIPDTSKVKSISRKKKYQKFGSIGMSPFAFSITGSGIALGSSFRIKNNSYLTIDGWNYKEIDKEHFTNKMNEIIKLRGLNIGFRRYSHHQGYGLFNGLFGEYNHVIIKEKIPNRPNNFYTITIKDQLSFGMQYGYRILHESFVFIDFIGNSGIRFDNQPYKQALFFLDMRMNYNCGVYNKLLIRIGYAF